MTEKRGRPPVFPFTAVLGQEKIKNALIRIIINPRIGGLLIAGEKGTAKSTLIRATRAITGGRRIVECPLNITEDRLVGAIDIEAALLSGRRALARGLLEEADGNILYVDEVNLLADHIVNALLDAASGGINVIEREGISARRKSRFVLLGSMNPEEGKLRPQFLDRFGLYTEAEGEKEAETRAEIVRRCLAFEADPSGFAGHFAPETEKLSKKIAAAKALLPQVETTQNALRLAARLSSEANCAGHRGELALIEAARAGAAFDGRRMVNLEDIREAAAYALPHRAREASPPPPEMRIPETAEAGQEDGGESAPNEAPQDAQPEPDAAPRGSRDDEKNAPPPDMEGPSGEAGNPEGDDSAPEEVQMPGEPFFIKQWQEDRSIRAKSAGTGKRYPVRTGRRHGRYVGYRLPGPEGARDLAFDATLRAAAPFQGRRDRAGTAIAITASDIRVKIREKRCGGCVLFVVDASASMGANARMAAVKAAIVSMLNVSYQKRDKVGLIVFRRDRAELSLGFTSSVELARKKLELLPTGGATPLARGLELAYEVIMGLRSRDPGMIPVMALVSDGRASGRPGLDHFGDALAAAERIGRQKIQSIILDTENSFIRLGMCAKLREKLGGALVTMEELEAEGIVTAVRRK
ncbi:MAG: VWA domain-containing protein [Treponema sp.]|nr:VWA domain-containing protein [Treponema sp.]